MNKAESQRIASYLETMGYEASAAMPDANLIVLNTCVVRRSAEEKVLGTLGYLKGLKKARLNPSIVVTGCFVNSRIATLERQFPYVELFFKPGEYTQLANWAQKHDISAPSPEGPFIMPHQPSPSTFVPIIQGCNNFCSYCIVPYRRGRERSRSPKEITCEVEELVKRGVKEVTLLGQNVNSYGHDLSQHASLASLLAELNNIAGLMRIRFLTNHPKDMSLELIKTIASLDKVCEHISVAAQAGDDAILKAMRRGYTAEEYRQLIHTIRHYIPEVGLSTDVIVGFPGETEEQFQRTSNLLDELRFDTVHIAAYSPRPGTIASRKYEDNIPAEIKRERLHQIEERQTNIASEINSQFKGKIVEVLVENKKRDKWYGRTRTDKLVFFESEDDCLGQLVKVKVDKTSPWALQGKVTLDEGN